MVRHALRMSIVNIITAKMIAPEIVNMAISSLIISVPILSVSPSWFIHVEREWCARNPMLESEFHVEQFCIEDPPVFLVTSTMQFLSHTGSKSNSWYFQRLGRCTHRVAAFPESEWIPV